MPAITTTDPDRAPQVLPTAGDLDLIPRALYHGSVASDYLLRTGLASALAGSMIPSVLTGRWREEKRRLSFYAELADAHDASAVYAPPPPDLGIIRQKGRGLADAGGRVELLRFASPFETLNPQLRDSYASHPNNAIARAQHWRHDSGPRPTLVVIHGFGASPARFNSAFFSLPDFFDDGWDVLLYTLPFHGGRSSGRYPVNGVELFAAGMAGFCEGMFHAIHDLRAFIDYLFDYGAPRVGVTGLSLGGYTSALLASVDDRLDFVVPNAAVTWLPPMLDDWFPVNIAGQVLRIASGVPRDLLANALAVTSALNYEPRVPHERRMVVAGLGDRLAPPEQSLLLWEHWDRPELHWFPGSHIIHFGRGAYLDGMRRLMGSPAA